MRWSKVHEMVEGRITERAEVPQGIVKWRSWS
jgi:hypothetical protein